LDEQKRQETMRGFAAAAAKKLEIVVQIFRRFLQQ
jgi:hypothetical protein